MTDLNRLKTSLTKHGAHKIAILLKQLEPDEILENISGSIQGVNIEEAQARKNLSCEPSGRVPELWLKAKNSGDEIIDALVLIAIVFSHHSLIRAMSDSSSDEPFVGSIQRDVHLNGKEFTNFAHTLDELGFSTLHSAETVRYNLRKMFEIEGLGSLARQLITLKLISAGWDQSNSFSDEVEKNNFEKVFSVTKEDLQNWFSSGYLGEISSGILENLGDMEFFIHAQDDTTTEPFKFVPGHSPKLTGSISVSSKSNVHSINFVHNEIQNSMYEDLSKEFGKDFVRTEAPTGQGTAIDLVVEKDGLYWFYEIKTANSVKACIRQAIPQLLEYAYWHTGKETVSKLIIVSKNPITEEADRYLETLRERFNLPLYYEQFPSKQK